MNNRRHNRRGWFYVTNEIDAFTREDHRGIEIVPFGCPRIARRLSGGLFSSATKGRASPKESMTAAGL